MEFYTNFSRHFDKVRVRGYRNGKRFKQEFKYSPYHFVPDDLVLDDKCWFEDDGKQYKTVKDKPVKRICFDSMKDSRAFIDANRENVFGSNLYEYVYVNDTWKDDIKFDPSLIRIGNFDIETDSHGGYGTAEKADKAIISISMKLFGAKEMFVLGLKDYTPTMEHPVKVNYVKCDSEKELLLLFIEIWRRLDFDVVTGWNIDGYDIPYVVRRITSQLGEEMARKLSPWSNITTRTASFFGTETTYFGFAGIATIDYLEAYKKFTFANEESYRLDFISHKVLGVGKLDYSEYGNLDELYIKNPDLFIDYNIIDVLRVEQIDQKQKFMGQIFTLAYYAKVNFNDTFTTVRIWDTMIHNYLRETDTVVPQSLGHTKEERNVGGYVKDPAPGRYGYCASFDFASLYPNMCIMYNISPETFMGKIPGLSDNKFTTIDMILDGYITEDITSKLVSSDLCVSGKGTLFSRKKQGFIPALMSRLFKMRKAYKKQMLAAESARSAAEKGSPAWVKADNDYTEFNNKQMAVKILLNSGYGALANEYFRWYSNDLAESITMSGQLSTRWAERAINDFINRVAKTDGVDYVIACDTDSAYVNLQRVVEAAFPGLSQSDVTQSSVVEFLDNFCRDGLGTVINEVFESLRAKVNAFEMTLDMKREVIASDAVWTGKKHYCMKIWNKEGVAYPSGKLKITGLEAVKSSTPTAVRAMMMKAIPLILDNKEKDVVAYFDQALEEFKKLPFDQMGKPNGVSEFLKYADPATVVKDKSGAPPYAKGCLYYNYLLKKLNVETKYTPVHQGDKIRWCPLLPNPHGIPVIASADALPAEFGLDQYLDYETQFEAIFLKPMKDLARAGGMSLSTQFDIADLWV